MFLKVVAIIAIVLQLGNVGKSCRKSEFACSTAEENNSNKCIGSNRLCDGILDCDDGSDEPPNCTPCNVTYLGEVGRTYELEIKRPSESQLPFLCHLNFTAAGGNLGELVQITFESFSVGTFESFTSQGCPDGYISLKEGIRPFSGGKWCGSAWGYTVYYSETSNVNLTLKLERLPHHASNGNNFEFKLSYKFLKLSDAKIRYGNATQRTYRGKLSSGSYCDRLLENCSRRPCRIQSPNYPGIYPRNLSCLYRVRERNVPQGKHALIALRQANFHYKENSPKFDNSDRVLKIWDQCTMMQDFIEILDGWGPSATTLAHLCSGETVPQIISSGPELLLKFHTSPYGNPFHPLPLSYLPGFELEVEVFFVNKESPTYIEHGKKCEFLVTTFDKSSGLLESPRHSLPANTTCHYHFKGHPKEVIWISFIKYHVNVNNERQAVADSSSSECDVQLQIWDGDINLVDKTVPLIGQFCREDKPKLCDHSMLKNSSRLAIRPCGLGESYISTGPDLTIAQSMKYGSVLYPVSFVMRYEFVDMAQEGVSSHHSQCDRTFRDTSGRFYNPKIPFLYGRGGRDELTCDYTLESDNEGYFKISFTKTSFGGRDCRSIYNPETGRWFCSVLTDDSSADIRVFEYPWPGVEIARDCICHNTTSPVTVTTKTATRVVVRFTINDMTITDDYKDFAFEANYEFQPHDNCQNSYYKSDYRRLKSSSGDITVKSDDHRTLTTTLNFLTNQTLFSHCLHQQPWLIEPEDPFNNFIYLKVRGVKKDSRLCPSKNRILVYPAGRSEDLKVICPHLDEAVEMFSEGWSPVSYQRSSLGNINSRSFVIEFLQRESGNFGISWMEVSKNPALTLPSTMLMTHPPDCPHSCPELGACISSNLWCDGLRHCPSGNDEQESNCALGGGFQVIFIPYLNPVVISAVTLAVITTIVVVCLCVYKHWRKEHKKTSIVVTEHTFLQFKSGLC